MASQSEIAAVLSGRLDQGIETLRDAEGRPAALSVPLSDEITVELGLNPLGGPFLRVRHGMDRASADRREARMAEILRLTASARFGAGWIGGCEPDNVLTLAVALPPQADSAAIEALIAAAVAILRDGREAGAGAGATAAPTPEPAVGHDWLRL